MCNVTNYSTEDGVIEFSTTSKDGSENTVRIEASGGFFVNGKLVENDKEVYYGFKQFLADVGYPKVSQHSSE